MNIKSKPAQDSRKCEIFDNALSVWVETANALVLQCGVLFRMFEPDGTRVVDSNGNNVWVVSNAPYYDPDIFTWIIPTTY